MRKRQLNLVRLIEGDYGALHPPAWPLDFGDLMDLIKAWRHSSVPTIDFALPSKWGGNSQVLRKPFKL